MTCFYDQNIIQNDPKYHQERIAYKSSPNHHQIINKSSPNYHQSQAPPLTSICVAIKTAVNPVTHLHEIIAISGLVHKKVNCDGE
jgi:hypothetical protein